MNFRDIVLSAIAYKGKEYQKTVRVHGSAEVSRMFYGTSRERICVLEVIQRPTYASAINRDYSETIFAPDQKAAITLAIKASLPNGFEITWIGKGAGMYDDYLMFHIEKTH